MQKGNTIFDDPELTPVRDVDLVPNAQAESGIVAVIERLAANPDVDVAKLEKIIDLQERILRHEAEAAFNASFSVMQADIPTIIERAETDKTTYATLEDIMEGVRPVLCRHGFSLSHKTEWPDLKTVKVIGLLTHREGHCRTSEFVSGADQTGSKNGIQALGSAVAYGRRYTTKDLLNIVTRGEDNDAQTAEPPKKTEKPTPAGYDEWIDKLQDASMQGMPVFEKQWADPTTKTHREYLMATAPKMLASLKVAAANAGR